MTTMERAREAGMAMLTDEELRARFTDEEVRKYVAEAQEVAAGAAYNVNERRFASEETLFNIWEGQSPDGRKHADAQDGTPAFPFEGASDARIRLADQLVHERVLILVAAALRNVPRVKGLELGNEALGQKLTVLLKWVLKNRLGAKYLRTVFKLARYQEADSPAGAMLGVWWTTEQALEMKKVNLQELQAALAEHMGIGGGNGSVQSSVSGGQNGQTSFGINGGMGQRGPAEAGTPYPEGMGGGEMDPQFVQAVQMFGRVWNQLESQLRNPAQDGETAGLLMQHLPHLKVQRAREMVKELRESGEASYPNVYVRRDEPELCAYRLYEHIFFPTNTGGDVERGRCYFIREWLSEVELRQRVVSQGYGEEWVEEVIEKAEGMTGWPMYRRNPTQGDFMVIKQEESKEAQRGLYEVNTCVFKAVNEENVPGIYYFAFNFQAEGAAHERRMLEYEHGEYPLKYFSREVLGERLLDSRGVPEVAATEQSALKLLADSFSDNVSLATVPPIKVPRRRTKLSLVIGPLKVIREDRPGDVSWMEPPRYPEGNEKQQGLVKARVDEYFGRISETVPPMLTQLHQTGMVMLFLSSLGEGLTQLLQLCQQYMGDEEIALVTGEDGVAIAHSREEIQGKFNVELSFDPRDLDMEYLKTIAEIIVKVILPADTLNTVQRDKLVQRLFMAIDPNLAVETLRPVADASADEVKDESVNFARIAAGDEPEMVAEGQNFPLRLQVLRTIMQKNPEAVSRMGEVSKEILQARLKYLENQVQQLQNAQIGRQVGMPALGGNGAGGGGGVGRGLMGQ